MRAILCEVVLSNCTKPRLMRKRVVTWCNIIVGIKHLQATPDCGHRNCNQARAWLKKKMLVINEIGKVVIPPSKSANHIYKLEPIILAEQSGVFGYSIVPLGIQP